MEMIDVNVCDKPKDTQQVLIRRTLMGGDVMNVLKRRKESIYENFP